MHELSLVQNLLDQLEELVRQHSKERVLRVTLEIGSFAGVVEDSLRFAFEILAPDRPATKTAVLEIVQAEVRYCCLDCDHEQTDQSQRPDGCPKCGSERLLPLGGDEMILQQVEIE